MVINYLGARRNGAGYEMPNPAIDGWMGADDLEWLYQTSKRFNKVVEVGCWFGRSTHALLSGCPGIVFAVDHFKGSPSEIDVAHAYAKTGNVKARFLKNVGHFKNLITLNMHSFDASTLFGKNEVDMVFIDGDHDFEPVRRDITAWIHKARYLLCGHDSGYKSVKRALGHLGLTYRQATPDIWEIRL
jgi:predicted O-methyltransferase YrrM